MGKVRQLAGTDLLSCSLHRRAETVAAFHRKFREKVFGQSALEILLSEFARDCDAEAFRWLPISQAVIGRVTAAYRELPATFALRAADAMHLGCAAEAGCGTIYSKDARLLEAAPRFGLAGTNII